MVWHFLIPRVTDDYKTIYFSKALRAKPDLWRIDLDAVAALFLNRDVKYTTSVDHSLKVLGDSGAAVQFIPRNGSGDKRDHKRRHGHVQVEFDEDSKANRDAVLLFVVCCLEHMSGHLIKEEAELDIEDFTLSLDDTCSYLTFSDKILANENLTGIHFDILIEQLRGKVDWYMELLEYKPESHCAWPLEPLKLDVWLNQKVSLHASEYSGKKQVPYYIYLSGASQQARYEVAQEVIHACKLQLLASARSCGISVRGAQKT